MKAFICPGCKNSIVVIDKAKPFCSKCKLEMFEDIQSEFNKPEIEFIPKPRKTRKDKGKHKKQKCKRKKKI